MKTNMMLAVVMVAGLVGGVARAEDGVVVLRFETQRESDARLGINRGHDIRTAAGQAELARLTTPPRDMTAEQAAKWQHDLIQQRGETAGRHAIAKAGKHAPRMTDADVMRRAKLAVKGEKLDDKDVDTFVGGFVSVFTAARMNARTANR